MNIKLTGLLLGTAFAATALTGCQSTTTTNANVNANRVNSNTAVVVNSNGNTAMPVTTTNSNAMNANWNANLSRADYDKDRTRYEAEKGASTIGQGANDSWIWFKTRSALLATNDLRESTINVDVNNDVITLRGTVATQEQKKKAVEVAKGIEGQKGIKDELKVAANDSMTNTGTTTDSTKSNTNTNK